MRYANDWYKHIVARYSPGIIWRDIGSWKFAYNGTAAVVNDEVGQLAA